MGELEQRRDLEAMSINESEIQSIEAELQRDLEDSLKEYVTLKSEIEARQVRADQLRLRLLESFKVDKMNEKKAIHTAGDYQAIVSKRSAPSKFDYDTYIFDQIGDQALKEIEDIKKQTKDGIATSKYVSVGKPVFYLEVIKRDAL